MPKRKAEDYFENPELKKAYKEGVKELLEAILEEEAEEDADAGDSTEDD
jgi:hypothetical protein